MTQTTPPYKYLDLAGEPTKKLVEEIMHRLREEPKETYKIFPSGFDCLASQVVEAKYAD